MADEETKVEAPKLNGAEQPLVIKLSKSVIANGDEVMELTFREPTGGDIEAVGNPVIIDMMSGDTPKITFEPKAMTQMMARLATVPPSTIRQLRTRDWNTVAYSLTRFFMPEW